MSQHDFDIANADGATVRADLTAALKALASSNAGNSAPATPYTGQVWIDTNTPSGTEWTISVYDGADWIAFPFTLNTTANTAPLGAVTAVSLTTTGHVTPGNFADFWIDDDGTDPLINWAPTDYLTYDVSANEEIHLIGSAVISRLRAAGLLIGTSDIDPSNNSGNNPGAVLTLSGSTNSACYQFYPALFNRLGNDGGIVALLQDGTLEGEITVAGSTVTYAAFAGSHWSQLEGGGKPQLWRGTVLSTVDALCVWRALEFTTKQTTRRVVEGQRIIEEPIHDPAGKVIGTRERSVPKVREEVVPGIAKHVLYDGAAKAGAVVDFAYDGGAYKAKVVDENNERLPMCKVSDTVADRAVYGVFGSYDGDGDMHVMAIGAFVVRVAKGQTPKRGDLLESNGDGCARVQLDDIVRASSIAKVTSGTPGEAYPDGSFLVACTLLCG